jgi:hypothetical protein
MKKLLFVLSFLLLFQGCGTVGRINNVKVGMTRQAVISVMGRPKGTSTQGQSETLNYKVYENNSDWMGAKTTPYYVRLKDGKVEAVGRVGDYNLTTTNVRTEDKIITKGDTDLYTELTKLDELRKNGIITEEEFEAQKKKVLEKY